MVSIFPCIALPKHLYEYPALIVVRPEKIIVFFGASTDIDGLLQCKGEEIDLFFCQSFRGRSDDSAVSVNIGIDFILILGQLRKWFRIRRIRQASGTPGGQEFEQFFMGRMVDSYGISYPRFV